MSILARPPITWVIEVIGGLDISVVFCYIIILEINKYTKKNNFIVNIFFLNVINISLLCVIIGNII